jgi:hypothetical protein
MRERLRVRDGSVCRHWHVTLSCRPPAVVKGFRSRIRCSCGAIIITRRPMHCDQPVEQEVAPAVAEHGQRRRGKVVGRGDGQFTVGYWVQERTSPAHFCMSLNGPGRVKTLRGITAPGILRLVVTLRAKKCKNSSSAQRYNQIRFRFHTA